MTLNGSCTRLASAVTEQMDAHLNLPGASYPLERVSHLLEHLLYMRLQGRAERTIFARRRIMVLLAEHLDADPAHATEDQLLGWQLHLLKTSQHQVVWCTRLIRPYYAWLHRRGHRHDDPAALLVTPHLPPRLPRPIPEAHLTAAVSHASTTGTSPRLLAWLLLAGWSGLRAGEIARLLVENIHTAPAGAVGWRVHGKGGRWREVPVPDWVWQAIAPILPTSGPAWRRERGVGHVTGKHVSKACNAHLRRVGFPGTLHTLHSLRHRVGTQVYLQTRDIRLVQQLLGHADPRTTSLYIQVANEEIAAAVGQLPRVALPGPRHLHAVPTTHGGTA